MNLVLIYETNFLAFPHELRANVPCTETEFCVRDAVNTPSKSAGKGLAVARAAVTKDRQVECGGSTSRRDLQSVSHPRSLAGLVCGIRSEGYLRFDGNPQRAPRTDFWNISSVRATCFGPRRELTWSVPDWRKCRRGQPEHDPSSRSPADTLGLIRWSV